LSKKNIYQDYPVCSRLILIEDGKGRPRGLGEGQVEKLIR